MAAKARVRVEAKALSHHASQSEKEAALRNLILMFKRRCNDYGVLAAYKEHQEFESKPKKIRRKKKEAYQRRLKEEFAAQRAKSPKNSFDKGENNRKTN